MFESYFVNDKEEVNTQRRAFLIAVASAGAGLLPFWSVRKPRKVEAQAVTKVAEQVTIVEFSDSGDRLKSIRTPKVLKSEEEWRSQLPEGVFEIARQADTELAFSGKYWNAHEPGIYRCVCCGNALFSSVTKFDSGTGWPSFWAPIAAENVRATRDATLGIERTAISCTLCDAHLGHVFDDGPEPTNLRYCMNSASLRFVAHPRGSSG